MMKGPFRIETKQYGTVYKHRLFLYNSEIGFKCSPSPNPPYWMQNRANSGNTSHMRDQRSYSAYEPDTLETVRNGKAVTRGVARAVT